MDLSGITLQVKRNCDVSDAKFWGYFSICGLLMRMRELYISEHSLRPWDSIRNEEITPWISGREKLWKELEDEELREIVMDGKVHGPFDVDQMNLLLKSSGHVYGSGYATFNKPTFFIARLIEEREILDYNVYYTGEELCRDLSAYPAMLQGRCIYVRFEAIRTFLWDRFQTLKARQHSGILEKMFLQYDISRNDLPSEMLFRKIERMTSDSAGLFALHEVGEAYEDDHSDEWLEVLRTSCDKYCELHLRGIKDILADTSEMGPLKTIIEGKNSLLLNVYMAFLDGIRKELFPEIRNAFQRFMEDGDWSVIGEAREAGYLKAATLREKLLGVWMEEGRTQAAALKVREYLKKAL